MTDLCQVCGEKESLVEIKSESKTGYKLEGEFCEDCGEYASNLMLINAVGKDAVSDGDSDD